MDIKLLEDILVSDEISSLVRENEEVLFSFIPALNFVGLASGIVGLILGIIAKKQNPSGMATAGLVLSIIGVSITLLFVIACASVFGNLACALSSLV